MPQLSPHFHSREFACKDGTPVPTSSIPALREICVHLLEPLRSKYGRCTINSGYRHRTYNRNIGGAQFSQHIYDDDPKSVAVDVKFAKGSPRQWGRSAKWRFGAKRIWRYGRKGYGRRGGVGVYPSHNFIHVDSGPRRDWMG